MTCGKCGNVTAPGAGFPNHVYCKRFLLHMEKREDASRCRDFILKPQTNGDKMRAMSDEDLAKIIADNIDCAICKKMANTDGLCPASIIDGELDCYGVWLKWLKTEVE